MPIILSNLILSFISASSSLSFFKAEGCSGLACAGLCLEPGRTVVVVGSVRGARLPSTDGATGLFRTVGGGVLLAVGSDLACLTGADCCALGFALVLLQTQGASKHTIHNCLSKTLRLPMSLYYHTV